MQKEKRAVDKGISEISDKFATLPSIVQIDGTINEEGDTLMDIVANPNAIMPDEEFNGKELLKEKLMSILGILDERERVIIEDYFGLTGNTRTLEDIGTDFGLTKERVRQIKEKGLRKLRNESLSLFEYL
jgi:RNA polymerase primary sigma factor